ncbi:MAG: aldehyde dehydrogenase family protein, partial [Rhizomicrobium sp.]
AWLADAVAQGAQVLIGGGAAAGAVYAPTLVINAEPAMAAVANDLFGPVLLATTFRSIKEAADLAQKQTGFAPVTVYSTAIDPALVLARTVDGIGVSVNAPGTDLWLTDESAAYVRGDTATGASVATDAATADVAAAAGAVKGSGSVAALAAALAARADTLTDALIASGVAKAAAKKEIAHTVAVVQALADRFAVTDGFVSYVSPGLVGIVAPVAGPLQGALSALAVVLGAGGRAVLVVPTAALAAAVKAVCPAAVAVVAGASAALDLARHRSVDALWYDGADAAVFAAAAADLKAVITDGFSADGAWRKGVHVKHLAIASKV